MSIQTFIRILPARLNIDFVTETTGAEGVVNVGSAVAENGEQLIKYVFYYTGAGKGLELDSTIADYDAQYITWATPTFIRQINERLQAEFNGGFTVPAGKGGALAGKKLQVRDSEDKTNWLTSQVSYMAAVQMGAGDVPGATFRTMDNETVTITFLQGVEALLEMAKWGAATMSRSWALKDAVLTATTADEINAANADLENGWPSSQPPVDPPVETEEPPVEEPVDPPVEPEEPVDPPTEPTP